MKFDGKEYISIREATRITFDSYGKIEYLEIYYLAIDGLIDAIQPNGKRWYINKTDFYNYVRTHDMKRDNIGMVRWHKGDTFTLIRGYDYPYAFNNRTGEIANLRTGHVLTPFPDAAENGRLCVAPIKDGVKETIKVHKLISKELPNNLLKDITHHINGDPYANNPNNLLPVTSKEHTHLHQLMKDESKKAEYRREVSRIRRENKSKLHRVPHPDFAHDDNYCYWMWIDHKGYSQYKNDGTFPNESIILEQAAERSDPNHIPYIISEEQ